MNYPKVIEEWSVPTPRPNDCWMTTSGLWRVFYDPSRNFVWAHYGQPISPFVPAGAVKHLMEYIMNKDTLISG